MKKEHIKLDGYLGKWYVISEAHCTGFPEIRFYLVEHETYGDETECLILNVNQSTGEYEVLLDDVWNGFDDFLDFFGGEESDLVIDY